MIIRVKRTTRKYAAHVRKRLNSTSATAFAVSVTLNVILILIVLLKSNNDAINVLSSSSLLKGNMDNAIITEQRRKLRSSSSSPDKEKNLMVKKSLVWHGGHPQQDRPGQCYCGEDLYCMCTPSLGVDLIIASGPNHDIWLVRRKDTDQLGLMGGFVDVGETVESAVKRELMEEMQIDLTSLDHRSTNKMKLFGVYSDPRRDSRRHTVSAVFVVHFEDDSAFSRKHPRAADDVKDVQQIPLSDIEKYDYFADYRTMLMDYRKLIIASSANSSITQSNNENNDDIFLKNILRSTCN